MADYVFDLMERNYLLDNFEPVLVLAGYVATATNSDGSERTELRFNDEAAVEIPAELRDFILFMQMPHRQSVVFAWLDENGGDRSWVQHLLRDWWLVLVPTGSYAKALAAFKGLRIVPLCYIKEKAERFDDFNMVTKPGNEPYVERVSNLLAGHMWESLEGEDLPSSADRLAQTIEPYNYSEKQKAAMNLVNLHYFLERNFVRVERVKGAEQPNPGKIGWFARLFS